MGKSYKHIKPIAQDDTNGCWSASMAWWTKAVSTVPNYTDDEILVEYSHLRGANGGLTFPTGFRQMLSDPKWGMTVEVTTSRYSAMESVKAGLKKAPVMLGFFDGRVGGHHAVVVHDYSSHITTGSIITVMDPNGGHHVTHHHIWSIGSCHAIIVGYLK
jgi:hypothetical protein